MEPSGEDDTVAATEPADDRAPAVGMVTGDLIGGRYRITRFLGGGGMGNVYAAVDIELGEPLAIKVLRHGLSDDAVERFRREVRLQRRITHKNVARIFDIGEHRGEKLLTMELVDGESLSARLGRLGKLPLPELRAIATDILSGLSAAHAAGVVHLDLKPGNVLLARDGRAVIADFGIARVGASEPGEIAGTPIYMAPEQHAGDTALDARTDLYAFGVVLYELATGRRLFDGQTFEELAALKLAPIDPAAFVTDLPPALVAVIQRCLAPVPADRPANADELIAAVERALRGAVGSGVISLPTPGQAPPAATVAVLPVTAGDGDAYLATGLAEDLADALSRSPGLRVLPATAVRGMTATGIAAGAALGVDHVVEGSIRRTGDALRVAVRLVSVRDGFQVWADRRDIRDSELLATGDALADGLAAALSTAASRRDEIDPRAVDLYLRARHVMRDLWGQPIEAAIAMLEEAAQAAPSSPTILATLATARVRSWMLTGSAEAEGLARAAAEQAMAVGPFHGEARYARAQVRTNNGDLVGGAVDLGAAIALAPLLAEAHYTAGLVLSEIGSLEEGATRFRHCFEIDPGLRPLVESDLARISALEGDWTDATRRLDAIEASENPHIARLGGLYRARIAGWRGERQAALARLVDAPQRSSFQIDHLMDAIRQMLIAGDVDPPTWRALLAANDSPTRPMRSRMMSMQILSEVAMANGKPDLARSGLEQVAALGLIDVVWLRRCPLWSSIAGEPWFGAVVAQTAARAQQVGAAYRSGLAGR